MSGERWRGAVLYGLTALVLALGAGWWWYAAPRERVDPQLMAWRLAVEQLLPEAENLTEVESLALPAGVSHEQYAADVGQGEYLISVICAGPDASRARVRLSSTAADSGVGLSCSGARTPQTFTVSLAGELQLTVDVGEAGPVVFRYTVQRLGP